MELFGGSNRKHTYFGVCVLIVVNVLFIATTAPAMWGKVNLETLLFRGGAYEELCPENEPPVCEAQKLAVSNSFTWSIASLKLSGIVLGPLIDHAGPKLTGFIGQMMYGSAILLLTQNQVFFGFLLMGASMNLVFNSTLSVSSLLPRRRNLVMSILSSGGDAGYFTFFILRHVHDAVGGRVAVVFFYYLGVVMFQILIALLVFPLKPFTIQNSPEYSDEMLPLNNKVTRSLYSRTHLESARSLATLNWKMEVLGRGPPRNYHEMTLRHQLKTPHLWVFMPLFCLFFFQKMVINDSVSDHLMSIPGATPTDVDKIKDWFSISQALGFFWAWMFGLLADRIGVAPVLFIVNTVGVIFSVLRLIPSVTTQVVTYLFFAVFKSYTISSAYAFVSDAYGYTHLGTLTGLLQIVAGVFVLFNIPFRRWVSHLGGDWFYPNLVLLILTVAGTAVPVYLWMNPPPVPHAPPHIRRKGTSLFSGIYKPGCRAVSAGPMFTEMDMPLCTRCQEFECCCEEDMYCLKQSTFDNEHDRMCT